MSTYLHSKTISTISERLWRKDESALSTNKAKHQCKRRIYSRMGKAVEQGECRIVCQEPLYGEFISHNLWRAPMDGQGLTSKLAFVEVYY
jgi:hypothetical protein